MPTDQKNTPKSLNTLLNQRAQPRYWLLAIGYSICLLLCSCGQTGALYVPNSQATPAQQHHKPGDAPTKKSTARTTRQHHASQNPNPTV